MGNCLKRHLKNQLWLSLQYLLSLILIIALLTCFRLITADFGDAYFSDIFLGSIFGYAVMALVLMGTIMGVNDKTTYSRVYMTFCCTRRTAFWGNQLAKLLYQLASVTLVFVLIFLAKLLLGGDVVSAIFSFTIFLVLWAMGVTVQSIGELLGDICLRFGKWGFVCYMLLCATLGGVIGFLAVTPGFTSILQIVTKTPLWLVPILLATAALCSAVSGFLWRKTIIKA